MWTVCVFLSLAGMETITKYWGSGDTSRFQVEAEHRVIFH